MSSKSFFTYGISAIVFVLLVIGLYQIGFGPQSENIEKPSMPTQPTQTPQPTTPTAAASPQLSQTEKAVSILVLKLLGNSKDFGQAVPTSTGFMITGISIATSDMGVINFNRDRASKLILDLGESGWEQDGVVAFDGPHAFGFSLSNDLGMLVVEYDELGPNKGNTLPRNPVTQIQFIRASSISEVEF